jgi:hypothetical protein
MASDLRASATLVLAVSCKPLQNSWGVDMNPYLLCITIAVLIFAVPMLIVGSVKEYRRWRRAADMQRATACKLWIGKDSRNV